MRAPPLVSLAVVGVLMSAVSLGLTALYFSDLDIATRVSRAEAEHLNADSIGTPLSVCRSSATCFPGWSCPDRERLFAELRDTDRVLAFGRSYQTIFFVLVDEAGRVKGTARCGS